MCFRVMVDAVPGSQRSSAVIETTGMPSTPPASLTSLMARSVALMAARPNAVMLPLSGAAIPSGTWPDGQFFGHGSAA
jgi:hypothetical protein